MRNYAATPGGALSLPLLQGSDATDRAYNHLLHLRVIGTVRACSDALPTLVQGHPPNSSCRSPCVPIFRLRGAMLVISSCMCESQGTPQAKMNRLLPRPIHQSCQPADGSRNIWRRYLSGQPLCVPRPCDDRGMSCSTILAEQVRMAGGQPQDLCGGGNRTAKGAQPPFRSSRGREASSHSCRRHKGIRVAVGMSKPRHVNPCSRHPRTLARHLPVASIYSAGASPFRPFPRCDASVSIPS